MSALAVIAPRWAAPARVRACFTTRAGGASVGPWAGLNLATHVGDDVAAVTANRAALATALALPAAPRWLEQVHGTEIARIAAVDGVPRADGAITRVSGVVLAVLVADCLPVLLCDRDGREVAAVHAGWRGLADGILAAAVAAFAAPAAHLVAWLGPAIGATPYVVGDELHERFRASARAPASAFAAAGPGRWHFDLAATAAHQLAALGVPAVATSGLCVHADPARFYSHRRDGCCGRQAALAWLAPEGSP